MDNTEKSARPPRPKSAVSSGVGLAGLIGVAIWMSYALPRGLSDPWSAFVNVLFCAVPMVLWSVFVDKVHRNPTTGIDWDAPARSWRESLDTSLTKLAGLWATWAVIAALYCIFRFYWRGNYLVAMNMFIDAAPWLFVLSIPYVLWIDTRLKEPRDGAWHLGALLMGTQGWEKEAIYIHLRAWAVKGFYTAFMVSIVPPNWQAVVGADLGELQNNPVALTWWLINLMFVLDVAFATVGYLLTMKPLDAHIRSATPYASGWIAALMCYPPFIMMGDAGPLNYHVNAAEWDYWLKDYQILLYSNAAIMVFLTGVYAWATIAFGLRFSNLTDRGVITHGPYAFTKHPAYLSKNTFWWLAGIPFLVTSASVVDAIRNTALMAMVAGIYYWRAKTEEKHLANDPAYGEYAAWMAKYGLITRWLTPANWRRNSPAPTLQPAE